MSQKGKKILFGISGGIAAYKAPDLLHGWVKAGCEVETIMTEAAEAFVTPLALSTLSKRRVWRERDFLSPEHGWKIPHISLTDWADLFVIAPCTAEVLRAADEGDGSTLLGAALLANDKPLLIFPAMNGKMLESAPVQRHIKNLESRGAVVVDPDKGMLACGYEGKGRLPGASVINDYVRMMLCTKKDLAGMNVVVTAGPTREYIDPVRFISNPSTGKMGFAIARAAWQRGAEVTLITGPTSLTHPAGIKTVAIESADEMYDACIKAAKDANVIIKAAAVGDYKAANPSDQKIKRGGTKNITFEMLQNRDIAAVLGAIKRPGQILVGFAAETQNVVKNARDKLSKKNLDLIVSNDVSAEGSGFAVDTDAVTILSRSAEPIKFSGTKDEVADRLLDEISAIAAKK